MKQESWRTLGPFGDSFGDPFGCRLGGPFERLLGVHLGVPLEVHLWSQFVSSFKGFFEFNCFVF